MADWDEDALVAAVDLVGRAGAREFEVGYLNDDVPVDHADWWAHAQYQGVRIMVEHHRGPVEAAEALARRLLAGATCAWCARPIRLSSSEPGCRWTRVRNRWVRGCTTTRKRIKRTRANPFAPTTQEG